MKFSKHELDVLKKVVKKIEEDKRHERIHISIRRKSQLKGKTINKRIQRKKKSPPNRRIAKRRSSIR